MCHWKLWKNPILALTKTALLHLLLFLLINVRLSAAFSSLKSKLMNSFVKRNLVSMFVDCCEPALVLNTNCVFSWEDLSLLFSKGWLYSFHLFSYTSSLPEFGLDYDCEIGTSTYFLFLKRDNTDYKFNFPFIFVRMCCAQQSTVFIEY